MAQVLIAGAGAIGSVFGGFLARAGHHVVLLGRPDHMRAIERRGLLIRGIWGEHHCKSLRVEVSPGALDRVFDAVLLTVKSYDTVRIAPYIRGWVRDQGWVISLQNGLGNLEVLALHVDPRRLLGGRVIFGACVAEPGVVEVTVCAEPVCIGPHVGGATTAEKAAACWAIAFSNAGIPAEPSESIESALWAKVFYNAALNPLGALLDRSYGALAEDAQARAIMDHVIDEAFAVALAEGVRLPWSTADQYRSHFYSFLVPRTAAHRSSMLQDLQRGKRTEVEAINGEIWRRGRMHGVPTPVNELLTRLIIAVSGAAATTVCKAR